jgi:two-component system sensor histidine kinase RegB
MTELRAFVTARYVTLAGLVLCALVIAHFLAEPSPLPTFAVLIVVLALFQAFALARLRSPAPAAPREALGHLAVDISALFAFFYVSGGATNPFVDLFLVPVAAAAVVLPRPQLAVAGATALVAYLALAKWHVPLPPAAEGVTGFHCFGAWVKYALCGGFLAWVLHGLSTRARERDARLAAIEQKNAADDYLARAGSLALGAAHEIRAPLCTLDVLVNDMLQKPELAGTKSLRLAAQQLEGCRRALTGVLSYGRDETSGGAARPVDCFLHDAVQTWRLLRPNVRLGFRRGGLRPAPGMPAASGLGHALINLLNNAADVSPDSVTLDCRWTESRLTVQVLDRGPGIAPGLRAELGSRPVASAGGGAGVGLLLAQRMAERAGGTLELRGRPDGGTCAELVVPLVPSGAARHPAAAEAPFEIRYHGSQSA